VPAKQAWGPEFKAPVLQKPKVPLKQATTWVKVKIIMLSEVNKEEHTLFGFFNVKFFNGG
jgi:hypothetical protein